MRSLQALPVVMARPAVDQRACPGDDVERVVIQQIIAQPGDEAFHLAVLPGSTLADVGRRRADHAAAAARCAPIQHPSDSRALETSKASRSGGLRSTAARVGQSLKEVPTLEPRA